MRLLKTAAALVLLSVPGLSYELAQFNLIGFSGDGLYLAWEEYGIQDVTGYPWCRIVILDVPGNMIVSDHSAVFEYSQPDIQPGQDVRSIFDGYLDDDENEYRYWEERARGIALSRAGEDMEDMGIIAGNTGRLVVHHPMTDRTNYSANVQFVTGWDGPWYKSSPQFEVVLDQQEIPDTSEFQEFPFLNVLLNVRLVNTSDRSVVLLLDEIGEGSASAQAFTYGVRSIFVYRDEVIAVVLYRYQNGEDGPDVRYRVVTGTMPWFEPGFWRSTGG